MYNVSEFLKNINSRSVPFQGSFRFNEPMSKHTTFKTGGHAELWIRPDGDCFPDFSVFLLESARKEGIPVFILGGGANLVVSDDGIPGIVLDTTGYSDEAGNGNLGVGSRELGVGNNRDFHSLATPHSHSLIFRAGTAVDDAVEIAAAHSLSGLEFLAGMPGTMGGALWMNARCYDREMSDVVRQVQLLEDEGVVTVVPQKSDFAYKKSPFQEKNGLILSVAVAVEDKDPEIIRKEMEEHRKDRESKGHYRYPCGGSVFKNNRAFGKPTGQILDELGLRGLTVGDAQLAPWHGNIIINRGKASSEDILALTEILEERARAELGIELERELLFIGN